MGWRDIFDLPDHGVFCASLRKSPQPRTDSPNSPAVSETGQSHVRSNQALAFFLQIVEELRLPLVGAHHELLLKCARERLGLARQVSLGFAALDGMFCESERSRIIEMPMSEACVAMLATKENIGSDRLFSAAELRNDVLVIEVSYAEFDLEAMEFGAAAALVRRLSKDFIDTLARHGVRCLTHWNE